MGRKSTLTDTQKAEITRMSIAGDSSYKIAKALGVPESTVRFTLKGGAKEVVVESTLAIRHAENKLATLSAPMQVMANDLLNGLRAISNNLTRAAVIGSENSARLHTIAKMRLDTATIDPENVDLEAARDVVGFTKAANDASALGVQLLNANKDQMAALPEPAPAFDVTRLSPQALAELMALRNANNRS